VTISPSLAPIALVRATAAEATGATLLVAGLRVVDRSIKQLRKLGYRVVLAAAPELIPPLDVEAYTVPPEELAALRSRLQPAVEVAGDVVRSRNNLDSPAFRVSDEPTRTRAEDAIFAELLRGDLGVVARTLNKPISFRITRYLLCRLPLTPNQVTVLAGLIGLAGAGLIAAGSASAMLLGFFLAHLQSVLDGCDGELARVRLQQSAIGEWLDTVVDDALNLALTIAIGVGMWRSEGRPFYLVVGLVAAAMLITYNAVAYRELARQGEGGEVLKVRWWFNRGASFKGLYTGSGGAVRGRLFGIFTTFGRRDFFVFAWLVLALLNLKPVILLYAFMLALAGFVAAVGQLVWKTKR
jgi:phosphatidylglycerophosphate synthase